MCLVAFAWQAHPAWQLVLGANRDEFYDRPSAPAAWWPEQPDLLAGRDLRAGGIWLGVTRAGRFAAITNFRDPDDTRAAARSRGELPLAFLASAQPASEFAQQAWTLRDAYNGFNLLLGDGEELWYSGSRDAQGPRRVEPGVHALSNALLDTPWPKAARSGDRLGEALAQMEPERSVLELLGDRSLAPDEELPDTGVGLEWERALSAPFIATERYGTRSSTYLALGPGRARFVEREFAQGGEPRATREYEW
jgi:uncharacterized protein with NRDE domain